MTALSLSHYINHPQTRVSNREKKSCFLCRAQLLNIQKHIFSSFYIMVQLTVHVSVSGLPVLTIMYRLILMHNFFFYTS